MPAFRRQHRTEIATVPSDPHATERRITELYTKAVAQLVSDEAPVRFGGLYALERLAQDSPAHRQIIVNVICAYLRRPFSPTAPAGKPEPEVAKGQKEPAAEDEAGPDGIGRTWQQERQVRLTAQRILAEHLRDDRTKDPQSTDTPSSRFWNNIRLDLTGATLIDFNLVNGVMADANFHGATFSGDAWFGEVTFSGAASFGGATFTGDASFGGATFSGAARFGGATFSAAAQFGGATFSAAASFGGATFSGDALFGRAIFRGAANFPEAAFRGDALFGEAAFSRGAGFRRAAFGGVAGFHKVAFGGDAGFRKAAFRGDAWFDAAAFGGDAWFDKATIGGDAGFGEATFGGVAGFGGATFTGDAWFGGAAFRGDAWFGGRPSAATPGSARRPSAATPGSTWQPSAGTPGSTRRPSAATPGSARRLSSATLMPCTSSTRESFHPALHMRGPPDGASLTPTAVDTRLSARATTAILELPGRIIVILPAACRGGRARWSKGRKAYVRRPSLFG